MLDIPSSTLRRYVATFGDYLSASARQQRGRQFTDNDLAVLARIRDLTSSGKTLTEIGPQLAEVVNIPHDEQTQQQQNEQTAIVLIGKIGDQLGRVSDQLAETHTDLETLRAELAQTRQEMQAQAERLAAMEEWQKTPWYKRLGKKPPET